MQSTGVTCNQLSTFLFLLHCDKSFITHSEAKHAPEASRAMGHLMHIMVCVILYLCGHVRPRYQIFIMRQRDSQNPPEFYYNCIYLLIREPTNTTSSRVLTCFSTSHQYILHIGGIFS